MKQIGVNPGITSSFNQSWSNTVGLHTKQVVWLLFSQTGIRSIPVAIGSKFHHNPLDRSSRVFSIKRLQS